jgi:tRNA-specific 2-thiouridylase
MYINSNNRNDTVLVAMSGGVDSSVAAALLCERGYRVIGVTMNLWDYDRVGGNVNRDSGCCSIDTMDDARAVCHTLGVPHYVVNLRDQFEEMVTENFIREYLEGRTPNPCVRCNTYLKWGVLLQKAHELGADRIATGHYARITYDRDRGRYLLRRGVDRDKDQSYALWGIRPEGLRRTLLPVGEFTKAEVRQIARRLGLRTAEKPESQEICFVPDNDYTRFLREKVPTLLSVEGGEIVDRQGNVVGRHRGFPFYTVGQRRGLGLSLGRPVYVTAIDPEANRVVIGDADDLLAEGLIAEKVNWVSIDGLEAPRPAEVKIRYRDPGSPATLYPEPDGQIRVIFSEPQRAVTPGQSAVFYDDDIVLGGGIIAAAVAPAVNQDDGL